MNNGSQLSKDVRVCLWWVREVAHRELDEGETEGPDVGRDSVGHLLVLRFPFDPFGLKIDGGKLPVRERGIYTYGHIRLTPNMSSCDALVQLT